MLAEKSVKAETGQPAIVAAQFKFPPCRGLFKISCLSQNYLGATFSLNSLPAEESRNFSSRGWTFFLPF